jgi:uncharacterized protein (TIGR03083 family)
MPLPIIDTRPLFRPLIGEIVSLFGTLQPDDWLRPTVAGSWRVRDVTAHLLDTALRRLSADRDGWRSPAGPRLTGAEPDFVARINEVNALWIRAADRLSPRVLTDLYARAGDALAGLFERAPLEAPAAVGVSWAGEEHSAAWLDIGREFTEVWHHGAQIRDAVGAGPFSNPDWLRAVLAVAVHALPRAYRGVHADLGLSVIVEISGPAGGTWTLSHRGRHWDIDEGEDRHAAARATIEDEAAWRLWFNALPPSVAERAVRVEGDPSLVRPLLSARSVIV